MTESGASREPSGSSASSASSGSSAWSGSSASSEPLAARLIALSRSGRHVVIRRADGARLLDGLETVDALGTAPRRSLPCAGLIDFGCVGEEIWFAAGGRLRRHDLERNEELAGGFDL